MKKICDKANQKLSALAKSSKLTTPTQRKKLIKSLISSIYLLFLHIDVFFKGML